MTALETVTNCSNINCNASKNLKFVRLCQFLKQNMTELTE